MNVGARKVRLYIPLTKNCRDEKGRRLTPTEGLARVSGSGFAPSLTLSVMLVTISDALAVSTPWRHLTLKAVTEVKRVGNGHDAIVLERVPTAAS